MAEFNKIFIVAGEESGDLHGSALVAELLNRKRNLAFFGIGGNRMKEAGVSLIHHVDEMALMGFTEVINKYIFLKSAFDDCIKAVKKNSPARAILIDYPGFNLRLAKKLKELKIPITYFIPPQLWAWREGRIKIIKECIDQILSIFPFEEEWYKNRGVGAIFVGHPFIDQEKSSVSREEYFYKCGIPQEKTVIGLFPGSRQQEVDKHVDVMFGAIKKLNDNGISSIGLVGKAPDVIIKKNRNVKNIFLTDEPLKALLYSDVAIVSSGTISLETALFDIPSVVIYKMSTSSWLIAKALSKVKYVSMTNLIAGNNIYPELLQKEATTDNIVERIKPMITNRSVRIDIIKELISVRKQLGPPGAISRAAEKIIDSLNSNTGQS
ncbi:MAG: lipid-A-disaccharide synthase [Candidatus Marinimicrobia bacterium]|nr:lipid-A-disaccharide synthase [Candidatus Neomarinimicrobiota bacterium]